MYPSIANPWLRKGMGLAFGLTALFYLSGVDWTHGYSSGRLFEAFTAYAMAVAIAYLPYYVLPTLLSSANNFPRLQVLCFLLTVCLPLVMFPFYRRGPEPTNGWDYLLVPFWQLGLELFLHFVVKVVSAYSKATSSESR
jgi:hypothetical protein